MGFTYVRVALSNPANPAKSVEIELLIDTGAVFTAIPRKLLEELELKPITRRKLRIFGGQIVERDIGGVSVKYKEASAVVPVIFSEEADTPVLGTTALEALGYQVDPITRQLKPVELLMI